MNWPRSDPRRRRRWRVAGAMTLAAAVSAILVAPGASAEGTRTRSVSVIVRTLPGRERAVERDLWRAGGRVRLQLPILHGFSAIVPQTAWSSLSEDPAVVSA